MPTLNKDYYEQNPTVICKDVSFLSPTMQHAHDLLVKQFTFTVVETWRSQAREDMLFAQGKSHTHNSLHTVYPAEAMDIYPTPDGYNTTQDKIDDMHSAWKTIMAHLGNTAVGFAGFDPLHFSNNNGVHI